MSQRILNIKAEKSSNRNVVIPIRTKLTLKKTILQTKVSERQGRERKRERKNKNILILLLLIIGN